MNSYQFILTFERFKKYSRRKKESMIGKVIILFALFSISFATLNISNAKMELTWAPLHSERVNQYPRYRLTNVFSDMSKIGFVCFHPKRAQCFETIEIVQSFKDGKNKNEQRESINDEENKNVLKISSIDFGDAVLKKTIPMVPNPNPKKKVWILNINNQTLHCYFHRRSTHLERLGQKYDC